jgi:ribonuclease BN (tRNA processing enzyme)/RimJ/RimL family protein N-acetyltransferase
MRIPALSTPRLGLHPATEGDLDTLWAIWRDPEVRRYLFDDVPVTRERAAEALEACLGQVVDGLGLWTVSTREASRTIGCVGLVKVEIEARYDPRLTGAVQPLVAIAPEHWGRGYAREAVRAVMRHGFSSLGLSRLAAVNDAPNLASERMLRALGFRPTGECDGPHYRMRTHELAREEFVDSPDGGLELRFIGSGDAFGSGGRFQTCLHLSGAGDPLLVDCGASSPVALKRAGVDPGEIGWILLSHLHGDHFGGLPFLILDGQFSRRTRALSVAGPPGVRERVEAAMEVLFPGSSRVTRRFATGFVELLDGAATTVGPARVTAFAVEHASGAPSYALRVEYGGKVFAYSGDTEWTERLVEAARGADLFVCEAYTFDRKIRYHLDYRTLRERLPDLGCRRVILTHMGPEMLGRLGEVDVEHAEDGQRVRL